MIAQTIPLWRAMAVKAKLFGGSKTPWIRRSVPSSVAAGESVILGAVSIFPLLARGAISWRFGVLDVFILDAGPCATASKRSPAPRTFIATRWRWWGESLRSGRLGWRLLQGIEHCRAEALDVAGPMPGGPHVPGRPVAHWR